MLECKNCGSEYFIEVIPNVTTNQKGVRFEHNGDTNMDECGELTSCFDFIDTDLITYECQECGQDFDPKIAMMEQEEEDAD